MDIEKFTGIYEKLPKDPCRAELRIKPESDSIRSNIGYILFEQEPTVKLYTRLDDKNMFKGESFLVPIEEVIDVGHLVIDNELLPLSKTGLEDLVIFYKTLRAPYRVELIKKIDSGEEKILGYINLYPHLTFSLPTEEVPTEYRKEVRERREKPSVKLYDYLDWNYLLRGKPLEIPLNEVLNIDPLVDSRCREY